jgi:hypothetical protein
VAVGRPAGARGLQITPFDWARCRLLPRAPRPQWPSRVPARFGQKGCIRCSIRMGMMASGVVQFRQDEDKLKALRERGINPNEFAREAFEAMLRRLEAEEAMRELGKVKARLPKPVADLIREDRDSR